MLTYRAWSPADGALVWSWLQQFPDNNCYDGGPTSAEACADMMQTKYTFGCVFTVVCRDTHPVGVIGIAPESTRTAMFHGICFDQTVHGRGVAREAVAHVIAESVARGFRKIHARFLSHNAKVARLFASLGFVVEGTLRGHVAQRGCPMDMTLVSWEKE